MTSKPTMPKGLGPQGKALWLDVVGRYELRVDEWRLLEDACRERDIIEALTGVLGQDGYTTSGSMGQTVVHPAVQEVRQHRAIFVTLARRLGLPDENPVPKTNQNREAGQSRWASRGA